MMHGLISKAKRYAPPVIWMLLIFVVSGDLGSMNNTSGFLVPLIRSFFSEISSETLSWILFAIRKSGHLFEYAVLAILWLNALGAGDEGIVRHPARIALLFTVVYAGLDEVHQGFVKSRTGSVVDVGIDTLGAFLGLGLWKGMQAFRPHSKNALNNGSNKRFK